MRSGAQRVAWWLAAAVWFPLQVPAASPFGSADVEAGREAYGKCIGCHSPDRNRTGPMHCGVFGRVSGSVGGFAYSDAMRGADIVWDAESLDRFLEAPLEMVPGTTMGFAGVADETERRQLIAWLESLTASSAYCEGVAKPQSGNTETT